MNSGIRLMLMRVSIRNENPKESPPGELVPPRSMCEQMHGCLPQVERGSRAPGFLCLTLAAADAVAST